MREALGDGARRRDADRAVARFSSAKQCVDPRAELSAQAQLLLAFDRYEHLLRTRNLLDVDDLVIRAVQLLEQSEQVAERVRQRYRCICIDEYQDVNDAQATLIRLLAQGGKGLCVIGDPDQAIYGFRGARPDHFARFSQMYEGAQIVRLSATYRLTRPVLQVASSVLAQPLALTSDRAGRRVQIVACPTPDSEAEQIVVRIEQLMGGTSLFAVDSGRGAHTASEGLGFGDIAILTRTKAQHASILRALARSGIPCKTVGDDEPHDPRSEKVGLMTLHASKGRQFEVVFVAGVERGLLPLQIEGLPCDPDEERRLLYVGITRTRRLCIISYAKRRMLYGRRLPGQPCHFLRGLPEEAVERHQVTLRGRGNTSVQLSLFAD